MRAARVAKKTQRAEAAKYAYTPHPGQLAVHKSQARVRAMFPGNAWGKSTCALKELDWWMYGDHPYRTDTPQPPIRGRVIADGFDVGVDKILIPLFRKHVDPSRLKGGSWETAYSAGRHELAWGTGSVLEFMSYAQKDQGRGAQKFEGARLNIFWPDEHCPLEIIEACRARVGEMPVHELYTYTPLHGLTWEYYDLHLKYQAGEAPDVECFYGEGLDNPNVSAEGLKAMYAGISDPKLRAVRRSGTWFALGGSVYGVFDWGVHIVKFNPEIVKRLTKTVCIDPHPSKPEAVLWCGIDQNNQRYAYRELLSSENPAGTADQIRALSEGETIRRFYIDPAHSGKYKSNQDGKSIHEMYEDAGIRPLYMGKNVEEDRIVALRNLLDPPGVGRPGLFIMDSCPNLAEEIERNQFKPQTDAARQADRWARIKEHDDLLTCLEYYAMSNDVYQGRRASTDGSVSGIAAPFLDGLAGRFRNERFEDVYDG